MTGLALLRQHSRSASWREYDDRLERTRAAGAMAFMTSRPPEEDAGESRLRALREAIDRCFAARGGTSVITKETGLLAAGDQRPSDGSPR